VADIAIIGSRGYPSTYGGYETLVRHLAPDLARRGHTVTAYCRQRPGRQRSWMVDGVRCVYTPGLDGKSSSTLTYGATATLNASLRDADCALVLNIANGFFLPLLKMRGIPCAVNTDGIEWRRGKWGPAARRVFHLGARLSAAWASVLVADSRSIGEIWQREFGVQSEFIPYGGDLAPPSGSVLVEQLGLVPAGYVLAVARLIPENNVDMLLDAAEQRGWPWPLVVVGSANSASPIEERLKSSVPENVKWLGHVDDQNLLHELWQHAGVYVHGHSVGGTNPALLQALGCGAPTVAFDSPFNREVIGGSKACYFSDPSALGGLIDEVMASPGTRAAMSTEGRRIVAERYSWASVCQAYADLLERLAAGT
jgi:glycosyltransferase involved in cell wall biosynthesis